MRLHWLEGGAVLLLGAAIVSNTMVKQNHAKRIIALETRIEAIEERAGSCEVVPIP